MVKKISRSRGCYKSDGGEVCLLICFFLCLKFVKLECLIFYFFPLISLLFKQSHLKQIEDDYQEKLEKELSARKQIEKVFYSSSAIC